MTPARRDALTVAPIISVGVYLWLTEPALVGKFLLVLAVAALLALSVVALGARVKRKRKP